MKIRIVGGNFLNHPVPDESSIVTTLKQGLAYEFNPELISYANGGKFDDLENLGKSDHNLKLWMPEVQSHKKKWFPTKPANSVLVCAKRMFHKTTLDDAMTRLHMMQADAVLTVDKLETSPRFQLIDSSGNMWKDTYNIALLSKSINDFYKWTIGAKFTKNKFLGAEAAPEEALQMGTFYATLSDIARRMEVVSGTRFEGSYSIKDLNSSDVYISSKNTDEKNVKASDFIRANLSQDDSDIEYYGNVSKEPNADSVLHLGLYKKFPDIRYIVHLHAFLDNVGYTDKYFSCGDLRGLDDVCSLINPDEYVGAINLLNHGSLIYAKNLMSLLFFMRTIKPKCRHIGQDIEYTPGLPF